MTTMPTILNDPKPVEDWRAADAVVLARRGEQFCIVNAVLTNGTLCGERIETADVIAWLANGPVEYTDTCRDCRRELARIRAWKRRHQNGDES